MPGEVPPLARSGIDRAADRRTDPDWLAAAWRRARVLVVDRRGRAPGTTGGAPALVYRGPDQAPAGDRLFLGVDKDGTPYFAVVAELEPAPAGQALVSIREVGAALSDRDAGLFTTAVALANWHATHRYAPSTGAPTVVTAGGWVRVPGDPGGPDGPDGPGPDGPGPGAPGPGPGAPGSGGQLFPRTDPAVIMLIHDGIAGSAGRCLLGQNAAWRHRPGGRRFFSTLAGFVEPGESAEAAVVREVHEEVGVVVSRLRYRGSQAWPFPASLMLGFTGHADPGQPLALDRDEIIEARWFTRAEVADLLSDRPDPDGAPHGATGAEIALPGPASIAQFLIRGWLTDAG